MKIKLVQGENTLGTIKKNASKIILHCAGSKMSDDLTIVNQDTEDITVHYNDGEKIMVPSKYAGKLLCKEKKVMMGDIVIERVPKPKLSAPTVELNGDILTMTETDDKTEIFVILVDGMEMASVYNDIVNDEEDETETVYQITLPYSIDKILEEDGSITINIPDTFYCFSNGEQYNKITITERSYGAGYGKELTVRYYTISGNYTEVYYLDRLAGYTDGWQAGYQSIYIKGFTETSAENKKKLFNITTGVTTSDGLASTFYFAGVCAGKRYYKRNSTWEEYINSALNCDLLYVGEDGKIHGSYDGTEFIVENVLPNYTITGTETYNTIEG